MRVRLWTTKVTKGPRVLGLERRERGREYSAAEGTRLGEGGAPGGEAAAFRGQDLIGFSCGSTSAAPFPPRFQVEDALVRRLE